MIKAPLVSRLLSLPLRFTTLACLIPPSLEYNCKPHSASSRAPASAHSNISNPLKNPPAHSNTSLSSDNNNSDPMYPIDSQPIHFIKLWAENEQLQHDIHSFETHIKTITCVYNSLYITSLSGTCIILWSKTFTMWSMKPGWMSTGWLPTSWITSLDRSLLSRCKVYSIYYNIVL